MSRVATGLGEFAIMRLSAARERPGEMGSIIAALHEACSAHPAAGLVRKSTAYYIKEENNPPTSQFYQKAWTACWLLDDFSRDPDAWVFPVLWDSYSDVIIDVYFYYHLGFDSRAPAQRLAALPLMRRLLTRGWAAPYEDEDPRDIDQLMDLYAAKWGQEHYDGFETPWLERTRLGTAKFEELLCARTEYIERVSKKIGPHALPRGNDVL